MSKAAAKKKTTKKKTTKTQSTKKKTQSKASSKKKTSQSSTSAKASSKKTASATTDDKDKKGPKGITIVDSRSKSRKAPKKPAVQMPKSEPLIKPGTKWKPLIPSGSSAVAAQEQEAAANRRSKAKLPKKDLDKYRDILLQKRDELLGDITMIEDEALHSDSGSLSHNPQHNAENGSETFDQTISLGLAEQDRALLKEIDEALGRISEGTYGICLETGYRIRPERLRELPWTKYSIEAARMKERRAF